MLGVWEARRQPKTLIKKGEQRRVRETSKLNFFPLHNFASCHNRVVFYLNVFNKTLTKLISSLAHAHSLT